MLLHSLFVGKALDELLHHHVGRLRLNLLAAVGAVGTVGLAVRGQAGGAESVPAWKDEDRSVDWRDHKFEANGAGSLL